MPAPGLGGSAPVPVVPRPGGLFEDLLRLEEKYGGRSRAELNNLLGVTRGGGARRVRSGNRGASSTAPSSVVPPMIRAQKAASSKIRSAAPGETRASFAAEGASLAPPSGVPPMIRAHKATKRQRSAAAEETRSAVVVDAAGASSSSLAAPAPAPAVPRELKALKRTLNVEALHAANMEERPCSLDEDVPIFRPSERDLREKSLVEYAEWCARSLRGADDEGDDAESNWAALKIVLPESFHPARKRIAKHGFDNIIDAARLPSPNAQRVLGSQGLYRLINEESRALSLKQFKVLADEAAMPKQHSRCTRGNGSAGDSAAAKLKGEAERAERVFWQSIATTAEAASNQLPLYGSDVAFSLFDNDDDARASDCAVPLGWNMNFMPGCLLRRYLPENCAIPGVTTPMLYYGAYKSAFAWHVEDYDLLSCNYIHDGAPKTWYIVAPKHRAKFERLLASLYPHEQRNCGSFYRHKELLFKPHERLHDANIPFATAVQRKGELMVINAAAYHCGFNHGFNAAEAVNFATRHWLFRHALNASVCSCRPDTVRIDVPRAVRHYFLDHNAEEEDVPDGLDQYEGMQDFMDELRGPPPPPDDLPPPRDQPEVISLL